MNHCMVFVLKPLPHETTLHSSEIKQKKKDDKFSDIHSDKKLSMKSQKALLRKEKMLDISILFFPNNVFKRRVLQNH